MQDNLEIAKVTVGDAIDGIPSPPRRIFFILAMVVGVGLVAVAATALYANSAMGVVIRVGLLITVGGSLTALLALAAGLMKLDSHWQHFSDEREKEWRKKAAVLHGQIAESRGTYSEAIERSRSETGEQLSRLEKQNAALVGELEQLKRSERTLSQQRQMLESSKAVLELHVQERTQVLQKLKRSYELILNSAGDGIVGLDLNGKATFINPAAARMIGWGTAELLGKAEREIFNFNGAAGSEPGDANNEERIIIRKDGSRFPVEYVRTRMEENGRQTGAVVIFKDISERKRAELTIAQKVAELGRSNAELEQFAFVASHDLQEPLRKIQSFGDRLKVKCNGSLGPDALNYLERMQNASARMRTLIDDLLAFSRVIRDSKPFEQVDLGKVSREVLVDLEVLLEKTGGKVEVGELRTIEADSMQMRQLLLNLIGNALKFQAPGSKPLVKLSCREVVSDSGETRCELSVQDNGIGFDEEYAEKIFAVFQRLHGRGEYEGTGVGLAICRRITDRHQGTIIARSKSGEGATFIINLPIHQPKQKVNA